MATPGLSWGQGLGSGYPYKEKAFRGVIMGSHSGRTRGRLCKGRACFRNISPQPAGMWEGSMDQVVSVKEL